MFNVKSAAFAIFLFSAALALPGPGCATTQPIVDKIDHVIDCLKPEVSQQIPAIVSEVATDLLAGNYADLLTKLEQRATSDVVICAVKESVGQAAVRASTTAGAQPNASKIQVNGNDYLKARGATFASGASSENEHMNQERDMTIRAKFQVQGVKRTIYGESIELAAVNGKDGSANAAWSKATPSGKLEMHISNPDAQGRFEPGRFYFLDITEATEDAA